MPRVSANQRRVRCLKAGHQDRLYGTGEWGPGEVRTLPDTLAALLLRHRDVWLDTTPRRLPGVQCSKCERQACSQAGTVTPLCRRHWLQHLNAREKVNRLRGLCKCGRQRDPGFRTCSTCRERERIKRRRYRARKKAK